MNFTPEQIEHEIRQFRDDVLPDWREMLCERGRFRNQAQYARAGADMMEFAYNRGGMKEVKKLWSGLKTCIMGRGVLLLSGPEFLQRLESRNEWSIHAISAVLAESNNLN